MCVNKIKNMLMSFFCVEQYEEIISINENKSELTMDIETDGDHLFYANDILTHNSAIEAEEYNHSNIAGGISKIYTADNVIGIRNTPALKERGEIIFEFLKTRNSDGVGSKVKLSINVDTMAITNYDGADQSLSNDVGNVDATNTLQNDSAEKPSSGLSALSQLAALRNQVNIR